MSLEERVRGERSYYYFAYYENGKRQYLYLGSKDKPNLKRVRKAMDYIDKTIKKYNELKSGLAKLLSDEK